MRRLVLSASIAFTIVFPLLVIAASPGRLLPWFPYYRYQPLAGDTYAYYYCVREILASFARQPAIIAPALIGAVAVVVASRRLLSDPGWRAVAIACAIGIVAAAFAGTVRFSGAPQFGWPLVWSVPMIPLRAVGLYSPDVAFVPGLVISLACNVATVVAAYVIGRRVGAGERAATAGAALVAFWPLISLLTGSKARWNGQWQDYLGISNYTEPLSTACVTVALAIVLRRDLSGRAAAVAGALFGLATLTRLSNVLIVAAALAFLLWRRLWPAVAQFTVAGVAFAPAVLLYYKTGYPNAGPPTLPQDPFALSYARISWSHNYLWHPVVLAVLVPVAVVGALRIERRAACLLAGAISATAVFYTFYKVTDVHPRFLYVVLPSALVLWAAGADGLVARFVCR